MNDDVSSKIESITVRYERVPNRQMFTYVITIFFLGGTKKVKGSGVMYNTIQDAINMAASSIASMTREYTRQHTSDKETHLEKEIIDSCYIPAHQEA